MTITNPLDGQPLTVYNLDRSKLGLVNLLDTNSADNRQTYNGFEFSMNTRLAGGGTLFGGVTIERTRTVTCDVDDPNLLLYCDQMQEDIPFVSQIKLAGAYPLPAGLQVSGSLQSYAGRQLGVTYIVNRSVVPTLTQTSVNRPLIPPGSKFLDRVNQLDMRVTRIFRVGRTRLEAMADIYNLINSSVVWNEIQTYGPSLGRPTQVLPGRFLRIGMQVHF